MTIKTGIFGLLAAALLASCATSNDVVSGRGGIQKRKYNDGYYISWGNNFKKNNNTVEPAIAETKAENESEETKHTSLEETTVGETSAPLTYLEETGDENFALTQEEVSAPETSGGELAQPLDITKPTTAERILPGRIQNKTILIKKITANSSAAASGAMLILLVILAIILPPLAVFIYEGPTTRFIITLILWLIGWGVGWWLFGGLGGLCSLVAVIFALLIVLGVV